MKAFRVVYERHYLTRKVVVYAENQNQLLLLFPKDTNFIRIKPLSSWLDSSIRYGQGLVITERVVQQRLINLLELLQSCVKQDNLQLDKLLQETIITKKLRYFQYELCLLYFHLEGGHSLGDSLVTVMHIPKYISGVLRLASKGDHVHKVLKNTIDHFNFLISRNFRVSNLIYIQIFLTLTEAIAAHYAAKTKFSEYFFSIKFRGDQPPKLAEWYVNIFVNMDVAFLVKTLLVLIVTMLATKALYRFNAHAKYVVDWVRLRLPIIKQIDYIGSQLHIFRALQLSNSIYLSQADSIQVVEDQIDNAALLASWRKIVSEQEKYGMNTLAMVDALVAPSTTLVRPEPETFSVTDTDIQLLQMDMQQRYYRQDMVILGAGFLLLVAIPLWGVIAYALTQNYFWLSTMALSI